MNRQQSLQARIDQLKQAVVGLGDLRPGKLSQQYNVCGKAAARPIPRKSMDRITS